MHPSPKLHLQRHITPDATEEGKLRPGAREESLRLTTEKIVSILARCP